MNASAAGGPLAFLELFADALNVPRAASRVASGVGSLDEWGSWEKALTNVGDMPIKA